MSAASPSTQRSCTWGWDAASSQWLFGSKALECLHGLVSGWVPSAWTISISKGPVGACLLGSAAIFNSLLPWSSASALQFSPNVSCLAFHSALMHLGLGRCKLSMVVWIKGSGVSAWTCIRGRAVCMDDEHFQGASWRTPPWLSGDILRQSVGWVGIGQDCIWSSVNALHFLFLWQLDVAKTCEQETVLAA